MKYFIFNIVCLLSICALKVRADRYKEIVELQGANFELALSTYEYVAVLFHDSSPEGESLLQEWTSACNSMDYNDMAIDSEMASIPGTDPDITEITEAYGIIVPSIKVFRRGIMADYRGPMDRAGIAQYVIDDAQPSVKRLSSIHDIKVVMERYHPTPMIFGIIDEPETMDDPMDGYSIDAWGQFHAAADSLRGHAVFFIIHSPDAISSFKLDPSDIPAVFMVSTEAEGFLRYRGEILDINLSEWVLRNSAPAMDELSLGDPRGELYAAQFFSSRKLKFILFLNPSILLQNPDVLTLWGIIAEEYKGMAIFSYMRENTVADVADYFDIDTESDIPLIAAHQPSNDHKFKSKIRLDVGSTDMLDFVNGVVTGDIQKVLKSESPTKPRRMGSNFPVVNAVGSTVVDIVSADKDVLLVVYAPWCQHCKSLLPTYDLLSRAVAGEARIVIAKIDGVANDLPGVWGVKSFPTVMWFPAKDKTQDGSVPQPRPYWDAGYSLVELVGFVQRESSYDPKSLRVATSEQLGSLMGEEEGLRQEYDREERREKRNEGRMEWDSPLFDYLLGEVVFDGKVWHVAVAGFLAVAAVGMAMALFAAGKGGVTKAVKRRKD